MRKLLLLFLVAIVPALVQAQTAGAPWDGTRGNITVSTAQNGSFVHVRIRSSDPTIHAFYIWAVVSRPGQEPIEEPDVVSDMGGSTTATMTFANCVIADIKVFAATELKGFGQSAWFISDFSRNNARPISRLNPHR